MPAEVATLQPWDRRKGESIKAFHAFSVYRDLGPTRTLVKAAEATGKSPATMEQHSQKYGWVERAKAWDFHIDRQRQERREKEIEDAERQEMAAFRLATGSALTNLAGREAGAGANGELREEVQALVERGPLDAASIARLLELGFKGRRLLHGQPIDISKAMDSFSGREVGAIVEEIVEAALDRMPEEEHEGFMSYVRGVGLRVSGR